MAGDLAELGAAGRRRPHLGPAPCLDAKEWRTTPPAGLRPSSGVGGRHAGAADSDERGLSEAAKLCANADVAPESSWPDDVVGRRGSVGRHASPARVSGPRSHLDHSGLRASASVADSARMEGVRRSGDVAQASDLLAPIPLSPMSATRKLHSCGKSLRFSKVAVRLRRLEPEWTRSGAITLIVGSPSPSSARDAGPPGQRVRA